MKFAKYLVTEGVFYKGQNVSVSETGEEGVVAKIGANTQMVQFSDGAIKPYGTNELEAR